jgi:hypothetical protein
MKCHEMVTDTLWVMSMGIRVKGSRDYHRLPLLNLASCLRKRAAFGGEKNISETPSPYLYSNLERYLSGAYDDALEEVS